MGAATTTATQQHYTLPIFCVCCSWVEVAHHYCYCHSQHPKARTSQPGPATGFPTTFSRKVRDSQQWSVTMNKRGWGVGGGPPCIASAQLQTQTPCGDAWVYRIVG